MLSDRLSRACEPIDVIPTFAPDRRTVVLLESRDLTSILPDGCQRPLCRGCPSHRRQRRNGTEESAHSGSGGNRSLSENRSAPRTLVCNLQQTQNLWHTAFQ